MTRKIQLTMSGVLNPRACSTPADADCSSRVPQSATTGSAAAHWSGRVRPHDDGGGAGIRG